MMVNNPILASTLLLTILLMVGLFFFIRASVKDRTTEVKLMSQESEESLFSHLQAYFHQRAYRVATIDKGLNQVTWQGNVRPSWFMAIFLTCLAALGLLCFALVLSLLYRYPSNLFFSLILLSPAAGVFYWQKAGRLEQVLLKVETLVDRCGTSFRLLTVTAHRDELLELQRLLPLKPTDDKIGEAE